MPLVIEVPPYSQGVLETVRNLSDAITIQIVKDGCRLSIRFRLSIKFEQYAIVKGKCIQDLLKLGNVSFSICDDNGQSNLIRQIRDYTQLSACCNNADFVLRAFHDYAIPGENSSLCFKPKLVSSLNPLRSSTVPRTPTAHCLIFVPAGEYFLTTPMRS